jgi:hypothetical protein
VPGSVQGEPHLYIGVPGQASPKQKGLEVIKQRRFRLEQPLTDEEAAILAKELGAMMGIQSMEVTGDTLSITYDLLQATAEQIEARIGEVGGCSEQDGQSVCSAALSITLRNVRQAIWKSRRIEGITRLRCVPTSWP